MSDQFSYGMQSARCNKGEKSLIWRLGWRFLDITGFFFTFYNNKIFLFCSFDVRYILLINHSLRIHVIFSWVKILTGIYILLFFFLDSVTTWKHTCIIILIARHYIYDIGHDISNKHAANAWFVSRYGNIHAVP